MACIFPPLAPKDCPVVDQTSPATNHSPARAARGRAALALVGSAPLSLACPHDPAPQEWEAGLARLLGWLGVALAGQPSAREQRQPAPVFAPWIGWSAAAFQHGGAPGLPQAQFATSYGVDHPRGKALTRGRCDVVLLSPHPAHCAPEAGIVLPQPAVMRAMLDAAEAEGRGRIAIILHASQREAVAAMLQAAGTWPGAINILAIEEALVPLAAGRAPWDAIIAMPDLRSTVFALVAQAAGLQGAWPMLWYDSAPGGRTLRLVTCEVAGCGQGAVVLPLDATALVLALALGLDQAGARRAALRLHEAWVHLRDSGVTTAGRGVGDAPYVNVIPEAEFIALLCRPAAPARRPVQGWLALKKASDVAIFGNRNAALRVTA